MFHECLCVSARVLAPLLSGTAVCPLLAHPGLVQSTAEASVRTTLHRLLKPRTPDDCPVCRHIFTASLGAGPVPAPVRPWSEVKSRRGAPKRVDTQGFACPNQQCLYFGITDKLRFTRFCGDPKHSD